MAPDWVRRCPLPSGRIESLFETSYQAHASRAGSKTQSPRRAYPIRLRPAT